MNLQTIKQKYLLNNGKRIAIGDVKEIEWLIERVEQLEKELAEVKER